MKPEEFRVDEIVGEYGPGDCTHFTLWKREWNTMDAIKIMAKKLGVREERFGYAGLKDRNAITTQRVSAWRVPKTRLEKMEIKDIKILDIKEGLEKIRLGSHKGNHFTITLPEEPKRKPEKVPNLFGKQRFNGTELLGKALIERDWGQVIKLFKKNPEGSYEKRALRDYEKIGELKAIRNIDKKIRTLWINAWQSWDWNKNINIKKKTQKLKAYPSIPEMPELGEFPGTERETIMDIKDYKLKGQIIEFTLPKGSYATVLIDYLLS